jgi:hypothetical protein
VPTCIHYFCTARHTYTLGIFAAFYAAELAPRLRILSYASLPAVRTFGPGPFIFSDLDRTTPDARQRLAEVAEELKGGGAMVLNHPKRALLRFPLLRLLHERGINQFNVYRPSDWREVRRFPVFLRAEHIHGRALTGLLPDQTALQQAVAPFTNRDDESSRVMIVEFGNHPGGDGKYRKYAAFRVGDTIYAQHCYVSRHWWVRFESSATTAAEWAEHDSYARDNPHRDQLAGIFALAGIDYGRIDYAIVDGKVQVFEINTNPTIIHATSHKQIDVEPYARAHREALRHLLEQSNGPDRIANPLASADVPAAEPAEIHDMVVALTRRTWAGLR